MVQISITASQPVGVLKQLLLSFQFRSSEIEVSYYEIPLKSHPAVSY